MTDKEKAVLCTTGAYLVLAGPGTGKTWTIIHRIINLVKNEGVRPSEILCLTFSNAAAKEMIDRVKKEGIEGIDVFTFHGLCLDIIAKYRDRFNLPKNYALINDALKYDIMRSCLLEYKPEYWICADSKKKDMICELYGHVSEIKRNHISREQYFENLEENEEFQPALNAAKSDYEKKQTETARKEVEKFEKRVGRAKEFWKYYEMYCSKMKEHGLIDFDDCISLVLDAFKEPLFLEKTANRYRFLMVDEYQDTNVSQNELVIKLGKAMGNAFVVGDDDQMIYRFQGADIGSIHNYIDAFSPGLTTFCLSESRRSNQFILDASDIIASEDKESRITSDPMFVNTGINKHLTSINNDVEDNKVQVNIFSTLEEEKRLIVHDIEELIKSDKFKKDGKNKLNEIAILVRKNSDAVQYARLLKALNIPCEIKTGLDFFDNGAVNLVLCYLKALAGQKRYNGSIFYLLHSQPFDLCPEDFFYMWSKDRENGKKGEIFEILEEGLKEGQIKEEKKVESIVSTYKKLSQRKEEPIAKLIEEVVNESGIASYFQPTPDWEIYQAGFKLLNDLALGYSSFYEKNDLYSFLTYIQRLKEDKLELSIDKPKTEKTEDAVQVVTYHSSKGREFNYVFMPNLTDSAYEGTNDKADKLPLSANSGGKEGRKKLERRDNVKMLFVGMTRAKSSLFLSYSLKKTEKKETKETELISEIKNRDFAVVNDRTQESYSIKCDESDNKVKNFFNWEKDYKDLAQKYIDEEITQFSPTNLNGYLKCAAKYYLDRIIRLQDQGDNSHTGYGSAVHKACEFLVKEALETGMYPSFNEFITVFNKDVSERFFNEDQRNEILGKGAEKLPYFYNYLISRPVANLLAAEDNIVSEFEGLPFITKIDRIEKTENGKYQIFDYKTGKPKDGKEICWGGIYEDYLRQLGTYKYAMETAKEKREVDKTGFIFPDGAATGDNTFSLTLTEEDVNRIMDDYRKAIKDIRAMKFDQCPDGSACCDYCPYRATICKREKQGF